jgi:hypothetical protein
LFFGVCAPYPELIKGLIYTLQAAVDRPLNCRKAPLPGLFAGLARAGGRATFCLRPDLLLLALSYPHVLRQKRA